MLRRFVRSPSCVCFLTSASWRWHVLYREQSGIGRHLDNYCRSHVCSSPHVRNNCALSIWIAWRCELLLMVSGSRSRLDLRFRSNSRRRGQYWRHHWRRRTDDKTSRSLYRATQCLDLSLHRSAYQRKHPSSGGVPTQCRHQISIHRGVCSIWRHPRPNHQWQWQRTC